MTNLRGKLGDGDENPTCVFNEPRIGFRLWEWESHGQEAIGAEAQA